MSGTPKSTVFVATEVRLHPDSQGNLRADHPAAAYREWQTYLDAFGAITLVARVSSVVSDSGPIADGPGVTVHPVEYYRGLVQLLLRRRAVGRQIQMLGDASSLFIGRLPEPLSMMLQTRARKARARFLGFVVAEPRQLAQALISGPVGRVVGAIFASELRRRVAHCDAVVYVTQNWLQSLYPSRAGVPVLARSNVGIAEGDLAPSPRLAVASRPVRLVTVGTLEARHKGVDVLIKVVEILNSWKTDATLTVVGDGVLRPSLEAQAANMPWAGRVQFAGRANGVGQVVQYLDEADIYVSASRVEGLPRAVIEGMARALPVVATDAGGLSEIIPVEALVPIDDVQALARAITGLVEDTTRYSIESARNLETARVVVALADPSRLARFLRGVARRDP